VKAVIATSLRSQVVPEILEIRPAFRRFSGGSPKGQSQVFEPILKLSQESLRAEIGALITILEILEI
jgi:hypothetical protein